MPLINTSLPNLIQGVSQQPDAVRYDGQCEEQENALSSVVDGLQKRPATEFIHNSTTGLDPLIDGTVPANTMFHVYRRTAGEKYIITHDGSNLRIFNADSGQLCTLTEDTTSDFTINNNALATAGTYLAASNPSTQIKPLTVGDTTFLVNSTKTVQKSSSVSSDLSIDTLVFIKQGDYTKKYGFSLDGTDINVLSRPTDVANNPTAGNNENSDTATKSYMADSQRILHGLKTRVNSTTAYTNKFDTATQHGNLMVLNRKSSHASTEYRIFGIDGLAGEGIGVVHKEVASITDLPLTAPNNFKVKVKGDAELAQDDYYVKFEVADNDQDGVVGEGSWVECAGGLIENKIDDTTMPRLLVNTALNTFEIKRMDTNELSAGDLDSNPDPSFVTNKINNIFQFKNRIGFLSNDSVSISQSGFGLNGKYNFYRTAVVSLLDSDPIDVAVVSNRVTNLRSAQPFQENLILFSDNTQFVLKGGDLLTPKSVSVTAVTNFDSETSVDPIAVGSYLYFPFTRGNHLGLREFTVNATSDVYDSTEVTAHVPQYIEAPLKSVTGSNTEQIIAVATDDIYIYKFFFAENRKGLSSWSKFTVQGDIRGVHFLESDLYVLCVKNGKTNLLKIPLETGRVDAGGFNTHLDMRVSRTVSANTNTIQLPYEPESTDTLEVYTHDGLKLDATFYGSVVTLNETPTVDTPVYVGLAYTMKYVFSKQLFKAASGQTKSPSNASNLLIRNGSVFFNNSSAFTVKVKPDERDEYINEFAPVVIGTQGVEELKLSDGAFRFPILTKADTCTITLENSFALPSNLQSAEFESFVHSRSNRYG